MFIALGIAPWKTPAISHFFCRCPPLLPPARARGWGELGAPWSGAGSLGMGGLMPSHGRRCEQVGAPTSPGTLGALAAGGGERGGR